jgi:O-antigen/teichoic acid export membrane protein
MIRLRILRVAAGDLVSKAFLVGINLYLIRYLAVDQYSHFTVLLNAVFLGYQLACGPLERLYIAEHDQYGKYLASLQWIFSGCSAIAAILWLRREINWIDAFLIAIGVFLLAAYQTLRIRLQQKLDFTMFSIAEILKNGLWFVMLMLFLSVPALPTGTASLLSLLAGTVVAMSVLKVTSASRVPPLESRGTSSEIAKVLWDTRYVIAYSLIGAIVPYIPVMMATTIGDKTITATYGAAMRYQAILGMAVFAFNTALLPQMAYKSAIY